VDCTTSTNAPREADQHFAVLQVLSKQQYLGGIAAGALNYRVFEPDSEIAVRLYGEAALIRYRSRLHMSRDGAEGALRQYWHTDAYERRDGRWQVVWSQATAIA